MIFHISMSECQFDNEQGTKIQRQEKGRQGMVCAFEILARIFANPISNSELIYDWFFSAL